MRRLLAPLLLSLLLAAPVAAATIRGVPAGGLLLGTNGGDTIRGGKGADRIQAAFGGSDEVSCGGGVDVVAADQADRVAADCEVVSRRISVDPFTDAQGGQHETAVEPDSFSWGSTVVAAYQLGRWTTGAASDIGTAVSTDAGRTWRRAVLPSFTVVSTPPGTQQRASDPVVAYDADHDIWLVGSLTIESNSVSHVLVARSANGETWSAPVTVATGPVLDKDWVACDNTATSPFYGRCYAAYSDDAHDATVVQYSDDGGATWSPPVRAGALLVGTQPVLEPDGRLVVVAGNYGGEAALTGAIVSLVSTDGGATFSRSVVSAFRAKSNDPLRADALPSVDADSSGRIYAVWHDCRFRDGCTGNDLVLSTSTDGVSWTTPTRVAVPTQAFLPGIAADPSTPGRLGLVYAYWWPGSCKTECTLGIGFVSSANGGRTWSAPLALAPQPIQLTWLAKTDMGRMVGDYFSTSVADGRFVPVFALALPPLQGRFREAIFAASLSPSLVRSRR
ncbi:MAG TPA: sialidase family protein [Gaiellaceae bacterium]|nr:sialidase family protein [Gaiellaceae bacterium]